MAAIMIANSLRRATLCQGREREPSRGFVFAPVPHTWPKYASVHLTSTAPRYHPSTAPQHASARGVPATTRATTVEVDLLADESAATGPALLRQVLGRQILGKIATESPADALRKLGVSRLRSPPPPAAFLELEADLVAAVAAGADPAAVLRSRLGPEEQYDGWVNSAGNRCLLAPSERVQRFTASSASTTSGRVNGGNGSGHSGAELERWLVSLFVALEEQLAPQVSLSPHCLFHAHLFLAQPPNPDTAPVAVAGAYGRLAQSAQMSPSATSATTTSSSHAGGMGQRQLRHSPNPYGGGGVAEPTWGVGLLFHACEYPRHDPEHFPYQLGYCQADSHVIYSPHRMATRNLLWYHGHLAQLDVSAGLPARGLLWPETQELCTVYESDLGLPLADLTLALDPEAAEEWRRRRRERSKRRRGAGPVAVEDVPLLVSVRGSGKVQ